MEIQPIAHIESDFPTKFGIPRQSSLAPSTVSTVVFEPDYRDPEAVRGLKEFSHIWLIWGFSDVPQGKWSPTVRPPRLGGNVRMGVFATRSPFRPNSLGLSSVRLLSVEETSRGVELKVAGADLMDGTPIFDIKPYIRYSDLHEDAVDGFVGSNLRRLLEVEFAPEAAAEMSESWRATLAEVLAQDPRPAYQDDPDRVYGFPYGGREVKFRVVGSHLTVISVD